MTRTPAKKKPSQKVDLTPDEGRNIMRRISAMLGGRRVVLNIPLEAFGDDQAGRQWRWRALSDDLESTLANPATGEEEQELQEIDRILSRLDAEIPRARKEMDELLVRLRTTRIAA